jgi:hypothetical protein
MEVEFFTVTYKNQPKKSPAWMRSAGKAEDGTLFVPGAAAGPENQVFLAASFDGIPLAYFEGHLFVPADWLIREYPETIELVELIAKRLSDV